MGLLGGPLLPPPNALDGGANTTSSSAPPPPELSRVPWLNSLDGITSPLLRLHQEIVEFNRFVAPTPEEAASRLAAISRVQAVVQSIWPAATVEVFGSFATGLYLPTSDLDAVILHSGCTDIPQGLKALAIALSRKKMVKNMQLIAKARVPIIKFEEAESAFAFDVSFDVANGPEAAENVRALMDSLPAMRPLVTVIKVFLQQRELNEVYSGGAGSYAVLVMVAAFLQTHQLGRTDSSSIGGSKVTTTKSKTKKNKRKRQEVEAAVANATPEGNLGVLLVDFLRLYGRTLAHTSVGVSCRKGGGFYSKRSKGFFNEERPYLLSVEDPNDPDNDLGRNTYNASRIRAAFEYAYCRLTGPSRPGESLLHRILRLDPALFLREPVAHHHGASPSSVEDVLDEEDNDTIDEEEERKKNTKKQKKKKSDNTKKRGRRERSASFEVDEVEEEGVADMFVMEMEMEEEEEVEERGDRQKKKKQKRRANSSKLENNSRPVDIIEDKERSAVAAAGNGKGKGKGGWKQEGHPRRKDSKWKNERNGGGGGNNNNNK